MLLKRHIRMILHALACLSVAVYFNLKVRASGTLYYVDNSCGYDGDGTATTCGSAGGHGPFNSIANATLAVTGNQAGNSVLLKSGDTFRESYIVTAYGTGGNPLTIGAYGTGPQPIVSGASLVTGWTLLSGTTYHASLAIQPIRVWNGGTELTFASGNYLSLSSNQFDWESGTLYINVGGSPAGQTIEATQLNFPVDVRQNYITISGLHITKSNYANVVSQSSYSTYADTVQNCTIDYSGQDGFYIGLDSIAATNWIIQQNVISHNGTRYGLDHGIYMEFVGGNTIQNNLIWNNAAYGLQLQDSSNNNIVRYNSFGSNGTGAITISNNGKGPPTGNMVYGNVSSGDLSGLVVTGANGISGNTVVNNTFYNFPTAGLIVVGNPTNWGVFKNNILWSTVPPSHGLIDDQTGAAGMTSDYNLMGPDGGSYYWHGSTYTSLAAFQAASGEDAHSISSNPLFTNASSSQFWLLSNSPAIGAGTVLNSPCNISMVEGSSWPNSITTGAQSTPPTIGAFLFGGSSTPSPPTALRVASH